MPGAGTDSIGRIAARIAHLPSLPSLPSLPCLMPVPKTPASAASLSTATWLSVVRAYNLCDTVMAARLAALGVRVAEHEVLANLSRHPGLTQQALAARCFIAKSHLSAVIVQMEAQGLVQRDGDPADARVKRLSLTPAGAALAERTLAAQREVVGVMTAGFTPTELQRIGDTMNEVSTRLEGLLAGDASAERLVRRAAASASAPQPRAKAVPKKTVSRASAPRSPRPSPARRG